MKDQIVSIKLTASVLSILDEEARREGLSRSAVIRRRLLRSFGGKR